MIATAPPPAQAYIPTNGREWIIQDEIADYYRRRPCTTHVEVEYALRHWGPPGPWAQSVGATGNMRPDVVVWCRHRYMTVVEVKAGTASIRDVQQLFWYLTYIGELPSRGYLIKGILAAPSLSQAVHYLPTGMEFWQIKPEWRR